MGNLNDNDRSSESGERIHVTNVTPVSDGANVNRTFPTLFWIAVLLIASGFVHLIWLLGTGAEWEGPLSLRKPALFGISGGMTVWSIGWVLTKLYPHRLDPFLANSMAWGLLLEVGLITVQQWRGVASHFNHATKLDASIEIGMLLLITYVTLGIVWLAFRSITLPPLPAETQIAIRGGLWLLVISCGLGFLVSFLGERNAAAGLSPSTWGPAGVLKFPHGSALHAIQLLPIVAWLLQRFKVRSAQRMTFLILTSQILFLTGALWQTFHGRSRTDFDLIGGSLLVAAGLMSLPPAFAMLAAMKNLSASKPL